MTVAPGETRWRILFVDDEPKILSGIKRMLRSRRGEWDMHFANSGQEALTAALLSPFDVVVSDMRMPGMSGDQLLREIRALHPDTARIILSGYAEEQAILRSLGVTHQYLAKPSDPAVLEGTIDRTCALRKLLANPALRGLVGGMDSLPALPKVYADLQQELLTEEPCRDRIAEIVTSDVALAAKILQIVNSAFFGLRRRVSDVAQAVGLLGFEKIKVLALSVKAFSTFEQTRLERFSLESLWSHSLEVGELARRIARSYRQEPGLESDAYMAGLLHDAGKLVLASRLPEAYAACLDQADQQGTSLCATELETIGTTHQDIGAYLLGLWNLPDEIVEVLAFHHRPSLCTQSQFGPLTAVHVANALCREPADGSQLESAPPIDMDYLEKLGVEERLPEWRELAAKVMEGREGSES